MDQKQAVKWGRQQLLYYKQKMTTRLKEERPAEWYDLSNPKKYRNWLPNVIVTYFDFPTWLWRFDDKMRYTLQVDINSYRFQRDTHINDVLNLLGSFSAFASSRALRDGLQSAAPQEVTILPYWDFERYARLPFRSMGLNAWERVTSDTSYSEVKGVNSVVFFSPRMWDWEGRWKGTAIHGPGMDADEVLFHELVHSLRRMTTLVGSETPLPEYFDIGIDANYDNEEEFIAVTLCNIYMAEKGRRRLRSGHGYGVMERPGDFLKNARYLELLHTFKFYQRPFFDALAAIPVEKAWWNPVRDFVDPRGGR